MRSQQVFDSFAPPLSRRRGSRGRPWPCSTRVLWTSVPENYHNLILARFAGRRAAPDAAYSASHRPFTVTAATRAARVGVFTQPRPEPDVTGTEIPQCSGPLAQLDVISSRWRHGRVSAVPPPRL